MRVTAIDSYDCAPGVLIEWVVTTVGTAAESMVPPSFNQGFHLGTHAERPTGESESELPVTGGGVWIAATSDVEGHIDVDALTYAFSTFIERHGTLRSGFERTETGLSRYNHSAVDIDVTPDSGTAVDDPDAMRAYLWNRLNAACDPATFPAYLMAAVDRGSISTVVCGFDHSNVDGYSISIAAHELLHLYESYGKSSHAQSSDPYRVLLPTPGDFVEYCADEAAADSISAEDPRLQEWSRFIGRCGGTTPSFPLDLGVEEGVPIPPQATFSGEILDAADTDAFERVCRNLGAGMFTAVVSALGMACVELGSARDVPLLFPLHTRNRPKWVRALGWFTTNAPMTVSVGVDFADTLRVSHRSFRQALPLSEVMIHRVVEALGESFRRTHQDVFMVSYIDYTRLTDNSRDDASNAHHISNVTVADDAQFWFSRTSRGLSLRSRYPDTAVADAVMCDLRGALRRLFAEVASMDRSLTHS